jgi:prepilin-type processing-associated H-X9-DG protein
MSANHGEGGANVMYQDGHVKFQKQFALEASKRGEIYLNDAGQAAAGLDRDDTVLGRSEATPGKVVPISRPSR